MRIISDFVDYYDCMQGLDQDRQTLYIRKEKLIPISKLQIRSTEYPNFRSNSSWGAYSTFWSITRYFIGFCGKVYGSFELSTTNPDVPAVLCRSIEDVDNYVKTYLNASGQRSYENTKAYFRYDGLGIRRIHFEGFFKECLNDVRLTKLFEEYKCPIFVLNLPDTGTLNSKYVEENYPRANKLILNSRLRDLEFYRTFPPAQAYQEINMFMSNIAVPMKPIPTLDDVTMAESKGYDKYSFRKDPIKKKKKK